MKQYYNLIDEDNSSIFGLRIWIDSQLKMINELYNNVDGNYKIQVE